MKQTGYWYLGFGIFLIVCGFAGYLSNPEAAKTALISGSVFGGMAALCGIGLLLGIGIIRFAALAITLLLIGAFSWRASVGWMDVAAGEPKLFAASLITVMWIGAVASLVQLLRWWKRP